MAVRRAQRREEFVFLFFFFTLRGSVEAPNRVDVKMPGGADRLLEKGF